MNTVGWLAGGGSAPLVIGLVSARGGLGLAIALTSLVYLGAGLFLITAMIHSGTTAPASGPLLRRDCRAPAAQHEFLNLARRGLRQLGDESERVRALEVREPLAREGAQLGLGGREAPGFSTTNACGASPHCSCGSPTTATSWTAGCRSSTPSTSTDEMFSPPLMITSFIRSRIST